MQDCTNILPFVLTAGAGGIVMLVGLCVGFALGVMRSNEP